MLLPGHFSPIVKKFFSIIVGFAEIKILETLFIWMNKEIIPGTQNIEVLVRPYNNYDQQLKTKWSERFRVVSSV